MVALLAGDEPLIAFYKQPDLYRRSVEVLSVIPADPVEIYYYVFQNIG